MCTHGGVTQLAQPQEKQHRRGMQRLPHPQTFKDVIFLQRFGRRSIKRSQEHLPYCLTPDHWKLRQNQVQQHITESTAKAFRR